MKKRVADIVVDCLIENGITDCFSVVGGGAMHLNNAFEIRKEINKVYCHHEQACSMAAEGYARLSGKMAVVCVTSGPGGINALNGVQGAYVDSIPMIIISGHPRKDTTVGSTGLKLRCRGVQENDIIYMVQKTTKYAKFVTDPYTIKSEIKKALTIAMDGRRGPVWLDIPLDVQGMHIEDEEVVQEVQYSTPIASNEDIDTCIKLLKEAKRPCILTGSGIRTSCAVENFREFLKKVRIPIVGGALQADVCYNKQALYFGMSGSMGPRNGNFILQNADLILVLGNSLSFKQTGYDQEAFAKNAKIIMVDTDVDEGKKPGLNIHYFIQSALNDFFMKINHTNQEIDADKSWIEYCRKLNDRLDVYEALRLEALEDGDRIPSMLFWREFMKGCKPNCVVALGNSSCVHGLLQIGVEEMNQRVLVNYNCGSMGDDLPEAVGAAVANQEEVYCVTGDGSIMMNLQELQTIKHYKLPVKIIVFSNEGYAAIRNTCSNFFNGVYTGCDEKSGISFPEFHKIAEAFGLPYHYCAKIGNLEEALQWLFSQKGACVLEIAQTINEVKAPRLQSKLQEDGTFVTPALHDMSPFFTVEELQSFMYKEE